MNKKTKQGSLLALERRGDNNKDLSPTVTLTWHANKYKVHKLHERYILKPFLTIATNDRLKTKQKNSSKKQASTDRGLPCYKQECQLTEKSAMLQIRVSTDREVCHATSKSVDWQVCHATSKSVDWQRRLPCYKQEYRLTKKSAMLQVWVSTHREVCHATSNSVDWQRSLPCYKQRL